MEKFLGGFVFGGLILLVVVIGYAAYHHSVRLETFQAACNAKGGDAIFRYREEPLCLPQGAIIPIK